MQGHQRVLQAGEFLGAARADHGAHQFRGRPGEREVRVGGDGRPLGMRRAGPLVPPAVELREALAGGVQPLDGRRAGRGHVDVEDPRERGLAGQEPQERPAARAQVVFGGGLLLRTARDDHQPVQHLPAFRGRRQEAFLFAGEVVVEGGTGHLRPPDDIGDRDGSVTGLGDRRDHGAQQPLALRGAHGSGRQPVAPSRQSRLSFVRAGETSPLRGAGHTSTVA